MNHLDKIREFLDTFEGGGYEDDPTIIDVELTGFLAMTEEDQDKYLHHRESIKDGGFTMTNVSDEDIAEIDELVDKYRDGVPVEEYEGCIFYFSVL